MLVLQGLPGLGRRRGCTDALLKLKVQQETKGRGNMVLLLNEGRKIDTAILKSSGKEGCLLLLQIIITLGYIVYLSLEGADGGLHHRHFLLKTFIHC